MSGLGWRNEPRSLARSDGHAPGFQGVRDNVLIHTRTVGGKVEIEARMVFDRNEAAGQVFSTGSIIVQGNLSHNSWNNAVSTFRTNVLGRFVERPVSGVLPDPSDRPSPTRRSAFPLPR